VNEPRALSPTKSFTCRAHERSRSLHRIKQQKDLLVLKVARVLGLSAEGGPEIGRLGPFLYGDHAAAFRENLTDLK
jgi:hypothetical protein